MDVSRVARVYDRQWFGLGRWRWGEKLAYHVYCLSNPREHALWERLVEEERQILGATSSFVPVLCYLAQDSSFLIHIGRDTLIDTTLYSDKRYIIRCVPRGHSLSDTSVAVCGILTIEGSCGNELYTARIDSNTLIEVWNVDCGFRERTSGAYGCRFVSIDTTLYHPTSHSIVPLYKIPDSATITDTTCLMKPVYLRDVMPWWGR